MRRPSQSEMASTRSRSTRPPVPRPHAVRPDPLENLTSPFYIWATIVGVWMLSLLPWRTWMAAPDLLLLVIAFWCIHEPRRIGMVAAFVFGLLMDVHDVGPFGQQALTYSIVAYGASVLQRRLLRFDLWSQGLHMLPVFFIAKLIGVLICAWLANFWAGWSWVIGVLLTVALWPAVGWLLLLPQHRMNDADANTV
ncbi:MAG: rod shape-determining protein MreD [Sheuella sp.]|nr:rod shape-determining protein MreD [Sheuella sp.]